jgi:hypothetical protein
VRKLGGSLLGCVAKKQKYSGAQKRMGKSIEEDPSASDSVEILRGFDQAQQSCIFAGPSRPDDSFLLQPAAGAPGDDYRIEKNSITTAILAPDA